MVKACDTGQGNDGATADRLDRARSRRVPVDRHVRAVLAVVARVLSDQAEEVAIDERDARAASEAAVGSEFYCKPLE
jgi:hypothetical protein